VQGRLLDRIAEQVMPDEHARSTARGPLDRQA
jgi:hypothetical protein